MKLKKYSHYKNSGIEWIGEIPENWKLKKMNGNIKFGIGFTPSTGNELFYDGNEVWVTIGDMKNENITDSKSYLSSIGAKGHKKVKKGSLLYSFKLSVGKVAFAGTDLYTNEAIASFPTSDKYDLKYLYYHFPDSLVNFGTENIYGAKILNQELIKSSKVLLPPLQTQQRISFFLDSKTSQIENLIEKDKKLIELLKERRVSLINKAVTKGLDDSVKMKDSGVEWIGEIPESWEVRKLSQCFNLIGSGTTPTSGDEIYHDKGTINWLLTGDLNDGYISKTSKKITVKAMRDYSVLKLHPENSLVIAMYGATIGKIGLTKIKTTTNQACCVLNKSNIFDMKFIFYWFLAKKKEIISLSYGGGQPNISQDIIKFLKIQTPLIQEQQKIVEFLDKETVKIDSHIKKVEKRIELLKEYKKSLIYNVVTGKVKV